MSIMEAIKFNGKDYPVRTFIVIEDDGAETTRTIATESLSDAMGEDKEKDGTRANDLDCQIYFYIDDELINLSASTICAEHLDIPMTFKEELTGEIE